MAEENKAKLSDKLEKLMTQIGELSVLELADLVKALEEKFGVSAVPVSVAAASSVAGAPAADAAPAEEKSVYTVVLSAAGPNKIGVIKAVREVNQSLGLKEAKDLVEAAPKEVLAEVGKETAAEAKKKLEEAGATVELK